jgi:6-phospho-3-hexuloisomerase
MRPAAALLANRSRRWYASGQGRSGLVAQMAAMRLMHVGFDAHVVGEATAPAIGSRDGLLVVSGSGETPVTLNFPDSAGARAPAGRGAWPGGGPAVDQAG